MGQNSQNGVHHSTAWAIAKAEGIELARKGHTHITAEQREAIVETLKETHNAAQAAKKNGGNQVTAWKIAKAEGIELAQKGPTPITAEQREAIVATLEETRSAAQAARENGVSPTPALAIAKAEDIELKKRLPQRTGAKAQAANLV